MTWMCCETPVFHLQLHDGIQHVSVYLIASDWEGNWEAAHTMPPCPPPEHN